MKDLEIFIKQLGLSPSGEAEIILGGHLNWANKLFTDHGWVFLRSRQKGALAESSSLDQEFALHKALFETGAAIARPLGCNGEILALEWIDGESDPIKLIEHAEEHEAGDILLFSIGAALGNVHRLSIDVPGVRSFPLEGRWAAFHEALDHLPGDYPILEWAIKKLAAQASSLPQRPFVLAHRDFRLGNMLMDLVSHQVRAIIDWEFAGWSDPHEDIGWFCARAWRFGRWSKEAGGLGSREMFYKGYETQTGTKIDPASVRFWENVAALRWAIIALQQGERYRKSASGDIDLGLTPFRALDACYDLLMDLGDA